ncbi:MAG: hypothetical protein EOO61_02180 [Hymenobacter sp.]|nr:MAG: hypothetical protein EOO61_02180 [Hymenobacter sp.]
MIEANNNLKKRVLSGVSWSFLDNTVQQVLSLIIFFVLGRLLSPALFGILSTSLIFVNLLRNMVLNSVSTGLVMLRNPVDEDYDTGFWLCIIIAALGFFAANILASSIATLYEVKEFEGVIRATSIILLVSGLGYAHSGWAKRNFLFKALAMRGTISIGLAGAAGIGLALLGYGIAALVVNQIVASVLGLLLLWRAIPWRPKFRFSKIRAQAILVTAIPLGGTQSLQFIAQNFDTVLVTYLLGPVHGGFYAASKRIVVAVQIMLWQPMSAVALPAFAEVAHDTRRLNDATVRMGALVMATTAPLFAGLALTAPATILVLFGPKWAAAAPTMTVLAGFAIIGPSLSVIQTAALALKYGRFVLATTITQIALSLIFIYFWGSHGSVQIALCISAPPLIIYFGTLIIAPFFTSFDLKRYIVGVGRPLLCTAVMGLAVWSIPEMNAGPFVQLVLMVGAGALAYAIAGMLLLREIMKEFSGPALRIWSRVTRPTFLTRT